jgi:hypothetical protein
MGVFTDKPIENDQQERAVRWILNLARGYVDSPSKVLPRGAVTEIVRQFEAEIPRWEHELQDYAARKR